MQGEVVNFRIYQISFQEQPKDGPRHCSGAMFGIPFGQKINFRGGVSGAIRSKMIKQKELFQSLPPEESI